MHPLTKAFKYRLRDEGLLERAPPSVLKAVLNAHDMLCECGPDKRHELDKLAADFRILLVENKEWLDDVFRSSGRADEPLD